MVVRNSNLFPSRDLSSQIFTPASVSMRTVSLDACSEQYQAATQRVPLPEISASEPSAFTSFTRRSAVSDGIVHSTPSAPTPLRRSHIVRVSACRSPEKADAAMITKSCPQAVALTKGILGMLVAIRDHR